jgi:hypothetical protein
LIKSWGRFRKRRLKWKNPSSSLLFSSLLVILAAFYPISCDDALSPSEYSPLLDDPPAEGFWRIEGVIDAPIDWDPTEDSDLVQIWFGGTEPGEQFPYPIYFDLVFTSEEYRRWHFKTWGNHYYDQDPWHLYFQPKVAWWSHPDDNPPCFRRTWVQGYNWVEFGGGWSLVMVDEDWSYSPHNYADGIPRPNWKYYQPYEYAPYFWVWDTVYLDVTD